MEEEKNTNTEIKATVEAAGLGWPANYSNSNVCKALQERRRDPKSIMQIQATKSFSNV